MKAISIHFIEFDKQNKTIIENIAAILEKRNIRLLLPPYEILEKSPLKKYIVTREEYINSTDLAIALGGDGTFLNTARLFLERQCPVFGINRGKLGFLTEFSPEEYEKFLEDVLEGNYQIVERSIMTAAIEKTTEDKPIFFINDAVISKGAFSRIIEIEIFINDQFFNKFRGDGLIISTPTGSTAYSLSAGGPIITPSGNNTIMLTPVCPHSMSMRPVIIPGTSTVKTRITSEIENLLLTIDGQQSIQFNKGDEIAFKNSEQKMNLIVHPEKNFYSILREKLHWGEL